MKFLSCFVLSLLALIFIARAVGEDESHVAEKGSFVTLTQSDGPEFRVFVAGPAGANAAVLVVHAWAD
jgi:hypothetical protein